jgi:hypothetical protein
LTATGEKLLFIAILVTPALIFWVWSQMTAVQRARRVLRLTVLISLAYVAALSAMTVTVEALCDGGQLKGFTDCRIIPLWLANGFSVSFLLIPVLGIGSLGVLLFCSWLEWRARRGGR